jgi:D-lactate dehydrogenase (cytochrome)
LFDGKRSRRSECINLIIFALILQILQTVVTPTGEVIKTRARARKSSAGWDTTKLFVPLPSSQFLSVCSVLLTLRVSVCIWDMCSFIGAEGTLGVVTEATIRLAPLLPTKCAVVNFPNVEAAVAASTEMYVRTLLFSSYSPILDQYPLLPAGSKADINASPFRFQSVNAGYPVQCVEFLDSLMMTAINQAGISKTKYAEKDSLFFSTFRSFLGNPLLPFSMFENPAADLT